MPLYLDTEFNGFGGQLISLAIASPCGDHWYRSLPLPDQIHPWVAEHVVPLIDREPDTPAAFRASLWDYLKKHEGKTIIADWPADFAHLMACCCEDNGISPRLEIDMQLIISGEIKPEIPHNALSDAVALMEWHVANQA
jgi:hypothetical protein